MIREDVARKLCEQLGDKWEELSDSSKGWMLSKEELLEEADPILAKVREAVKGAGLAEGEIVELIKYTPNKVTLCNKVIKAYLQAILKALGGE